MSIIYSKKIDRAVDTNTGRFVSFKHARFSKIFREQYEPYLIRKQYKRLEKGEITREELTELWVKRGIPKKKWQLVLPPSLDLNPLLMYTELSGHLSKKKYRELLKEVEKARWSNKKRRILAEHYDQWVSLVKGKKVKK